MVVSAAVVVAAAAVAVVGNSGGCRSLEDSRGKGGWGVLCVNMYVFVCERE